MARLKKSKKKKLIYVILAIFLIGVAIGLYFKYAPSSVPQDILGHFNSTSVYNTQGMGSFLTIHWILNDSEQNFLISYEGTPLKDTISYGISFNKVLLFGCYNGKLNVYTSQKDGTTKGYINDSINCMSDVYTQNKKITTKLNSTNQATFKTLQSRVVATLSLKDEDGRGIDPSRVSSLIPIAEQLTAVPSSVVSYSPELSYYIYVGDGVYNLYYSILGSENSIFLSAKLYVDGKLIMTPLQEIYLSTAKGVLSLSTLQSIQEETKTIDYTLRIIDQYSVGILPELITDLKINPTFPSGTILSTSYTYLGEGVYDIKSLVKGSGLFSVSASAKINTVFYETFGLLKIQVDPAIINLNLSTNSATQYTDQEYISSTLTLFDVGGNPILPESLEDFRVTVLFPNGVIYSTDYEYLGTGRYEIKSKVKGTGEYTHLVEIRYNSKNFTSEYLKINIEDPKFNIGLIPSSITQYTTQDIISILTIKDINNIPVLPERLINFKIISSLPSGSVILDSYTYLGNGVYELRSKVIGVGTYSVYAKFTIDGQLVSSPSVNIQIEEPKINVILTSYTYTQSTNQDIKSTLTIKDVSNNPIPPEKLTNFQIIPLFPSGLVSSSNYEYLGNGVYELRSKVIGVGTYSVYAKFTIDGQLVSSPSVNIQIEEPKINVTLTSYSYTQYDMQESIKSTMIIIDQLGYGVAPERLTNLTINTNFENGIVNSNSYEYLGKGEYEIRSKVSGGGPLVIYTGFLLNNQVITSPSIIITVQPSVIQIDTGLIVPSSNLNKRENFTVNIFDALGGRIDVDSLEVKVTYPDGITTESLSLSNDRISRVNLGEYFFGFKFSQVEKFSFDIFAKKEGHQPGNAKATVAVSGEQELGAGPGWFSKLAYIIPIGFILFFGVVVVLYLFIRKRKK